MPGPSSCSTRASTRRPSRGSPGRSARRTSSVAARADDGALVEIVVAWELCWYRYEVDLADEPHAVRLLGQGYELEELGEDALAANAVADGRGELLRLGAAELLVAAA